MDATDVQEDVPQLEFEQTPITEADTSAADASEKDTLNRLNEETNVIPENAGDTASNAEADKNITPTADVTLLATAQVPTITDRRHRENQRRRYVTGHRARLNPRHRENPDVTSLATAQVPINPTSPEKSAKTLRHWLMVKRKPEAEKEPARRHANTSSKATWQIHAPPPEQTPAPSTLASPERLSPGYS